MDLLAVAGGDTVKLLDVSGDRTTLSYTPSSGSLVNSVKWNHTNLVVASAGDDKKISLWRKNGESMGTIPVSGSDSGDNIEESIFAISFSNKGSRYICSGGTGQVVRIWDLQRKRCIKWLKGHTDAITGVMYNSKDEHIASISLSGDLILHNLASSVRAAELKDPHEQVLRVLDYSRTSRHLLVTAGDDGSIHMWDTTGRSPKVSWLKQHSAPTAGVGFSPSNDKVIVSIGLDKKFYMYDSGTKRPPICVSYEAPFSSLAFRDNGYVLAAGTSNGRVVLYDVRGKPQPMSTIRAYSNSEAVTSLCWQRSKPVLVNESNCTAETALLGGAVEDSILMPDPLPSMTSSSLPLSTSLPGSRNLGRSGPSAEALSSTSVGLSSSAAEETPHRNLMWGGANLSRLLPPRGYNFKDDMDVFSPLVDVQPITPTLDKLWNDHGGAKKDNISIDKKSSLLFPSSRRFPLSDEASSNDLHPIFDWKSSSTSRQDDARSSTTQLGTTPTSTKSDDTSSITPPEAWGGERLSDKFIHQRQPVGLPSRFAMPTSSSLTSASMLCGLQDLSLSTSQTNTSSLMIPSLSFPNLRIKDNSNLETSSGVSEQGPYSPTLSTSLGPSSLAQPRRFSTYAERISTNASFSDATTSLSAGSPKTKKTGAEPRFDTSFATESSMFPQVNGEASKHPKTQPQLEQQPQQQEGSSFTLQLSQRALEETQASIQESFHRDTRNIHIEILRQFHMHEMEMEKNKAEIMEEVQSLRKEVQQLRQLLAKILPL